MGCYIDFGMKNSFIILKRFYNSIQPQQSSDTYLAFHYIQTFTNTVTTDQYYYNLVDARKVSAYVNLIFKGLIFFLFLYCLSELLEQCLRHRTSIMNKA